MSRQLRPRDPSIKYYYTAAEQARMERERMDRYARGDYLDEDSSDATSSGQENVKPSKSRSSKASTGSTRKPRSTTPKTTTSKSVATPLSTSKSANDKGNQLRPESDSAPPKRTSKKKSTSEANENIQRTQGVDDEDDDLGITWFGQKAKDAASSSSGAENNAKTHHHTSKKPASAAAKAMNLSSLTTSTESRSTATSAASTTSIQDHTSKHTATSVSASATSTKSTAAPSTFTSASTGSQPDLEVTLEDVLQTKQAKGLIGVTAYVEAYLRANFASTLAELKKSSNRVVTAERVARAMGNTWVSLPLEERAVWKLKHEGGSSESKTSRSNSALQSRASQRAAASTSSYVRAMADEIDSIDFSSSPESPRPASSSVSSLGLGVPRARANKLPTTMTSSSSSSSSSDDYSPKRTKTSTGRSVDSPAATPHDHHSEHRRVRIPPTSPRVAIPTGSTGHTAFVSSSPASSSQQPALSSHLFDSSLMRLGNNVTLPTLSAGGSSNTNGHNTVDRASRLLHQMQAEMSMEQLVRQKDADYEVLYRKYTELRKELATSQHQANVRVEEQATKRAEAALLAAQSEIAALRENSRIKDDEASRVIAELKQELARATEAQLQQLKTPGRSKRELLALEQKENALREMTLQLTNQNRLVAHLQTKLVELQDRETRLKEELRAKTEEWSQIEEEQERIISTYRLATCMNVEVNAKNTEYMRCKAVNREQRKLLEFDILIDAPTGRPGDETVEYIPRKVILNGQEYPSFLRERISFAPSQTPLLLKNILGVVHETSSSSVNQVYPVHTGQSSSQQAQSQQQQPQPQPQSQQQLQQQSRYGHVPQRHVNQSQAVNVSMHSLAPSMVAPPSQNGSSAQYRRY